MRKNLKIALFGLLILHLSTGYLHNDHKLSTKERIIHTVYKYPNPKELLSIIKIESGFRQYVISKKGARGLMQIHPIWDNELKEKGIIKEERDIFNIEKNIKAGHYILTYYKSKTKSFRKALLKYNGGGKNYPNKIIKEMKKW